MFSASDAPAAWLDHVRAFYPAALPGSEFILRTFRVIDRHLGLPPEKILLAHSICADDVNMIEYPPEGRRMLGPFNLGGLDGYPFAGKTGVGAFAAHVPDDGCALVFWAPHIGVSADGTIGKIKRVGQHELSSCCGAAKAATEWLRRGEPLGPPPDDDLEQYVLQRTLDAQRERVLNAPEPLVAATDVIYEASERALEGMLETTRIPCRAIVLVGAVIVNGDPEHGSALQLRRFELRDGTTGRLKERITPAQFLA